MIDLQTRLTSAALAAGIVLSTVAVASGQEVFDDFDDGQVFDHSPVSWGPECWWSSGIYDATSGDLVLGSSVPAAASLPVEGAFFEDTVSVRTQVRIRTQEVIMLKMLNAFLLLAGRFWQERGVDAQSTGPTIWCGDADGDGELPLSDAITILHHLFTGAGEPPHCIAQGIPLRPSPLRRRRSHRRWSRTIST